MKNLRLSEVSGLGGSARADYKSCDTCSFDTWVISGVFLTPFSSQKTLFAKTVAFLFDFSFQIWVSLKFSSFSHLLLSTLDTRA